MKTPTAKLMLAAVAATLLGLGAKAASTHDAVQLWEGGPYWATTNIGAEKPWDSGCYFWWGDTVGYTRENSWVASDDSASNFSFDWYVVPTNSKNYSSLLSENYIDSTGNLVEAHDAAHAHWGGGWRMPTNPELSALLDNCDWTWTTTNGVHGYIVSGKGDYAVASIFLPASGFGSFSSFYGFDAEGRYWSSDYGSSSQDSLSLVLNSDDHVMGSSRRYYGFSIRPVTMLTINITWLNEDGTEIGTTIVSSNAVPTHAEPTKEATTPYRYLFSGWMPALEPVVSNTTYTATFQKIADTSLLTEDWQAANGDAIVVTNATAYKVTIPGGATVTINGVEVASGGGGANPTPAFSAGGKAATTEFVQSEGGKWTLTTFAELSNDAVGADVAAEQIKVYAADSVEELKTATPMTSGVTVTEKKSAVKTTIEVTPPDPTATKQFFKVEFGE